MEYQTRYIVSKHWWDVYKNVQSNSIPPIDNNQLLECNSNNSLQYRVKPSLSPNDYILIDKDEWGNILNKFGGGPELEIFIINGEQDLDPIFIEVYVIQEFLDKNPSASFYVSKKLTVSGLKHFLCEKLKIERTRYEFFILKSFDNFPILKELKNFGSVEILNTKILDYCKLCLKFEDMNWDYSKNEENELNYAIQRSLEIQKKVWLEKTETVEKTIEPKRQRLRIKRLRTIKKNICNILANLKLD
jgi:DUSP domain